MKIHAWLVSCLVAIAWALSGCASGGEIVGSGSPRIAEPPAYALSVGDRVRLTVFGEPSLNGEFVVGPDGTLTLPLIGPVEARGKRPRELQEETSRRLAAGYLRDPKVTLDVLTVRPFFVLGEVNKPGQYPYVDGLSLAQAVATAGGYSYRASKSKVYLRRADEDVERRISTKDGRPIWILPGDTIRIGERIF